MSDRPWSLPEDKLLAQCRVDSFVAAGPGGQHRNRKNTAVRVTHLPSRLSAVATDSRSHRENQIHAIRALRLRLALELRHDIADTVNHQPPAFFADYPALRMNPKNPLYPAAVAEVLDMLQAMHWDIPRAAVMLGLSASALARFLHDDPTLWQKVNQIRQELGMPPLRSR